MACFVATAIYCAEFHHLDRYTYYCGAVTFGFIGYILLAFRWLSKYDDGAKP